MSQLDKWNCEVILYLEEAVRDSDGNVRTRASSSGIPLRVWIAPVGQSGTAARRAEQDNEGYETEKVLRMRLLRKDYHLEVGAQSKVLLDGKMYSVFGDVTHYRANHRTAHKDFMLRRA